MLILALIIIVLLWQLVQILCGFTLGEFEFPLNQWSVLYVSMHCRVSNNGILLAFTKIESNIKCQVYTNVYTYDYVHVHVCVCVWMTCAGAGTFGTVRAGIYRPKNGEPEVKCAVKCLKPTDELPNQKVSERFLIQLNKIYMYCT